MKVDMGAVRQRYDSWWEGTNRTPILYMIYPERERDLTSLLREWMPASLVGTWSNWKQEFLFGLAFQRLRETGDERYIDEALDYLEGYARTTAYAGDGYPFLMPGFGPGALAGFVSGYSVFQEPTIWFETETPWEWDRILAIDPSRKTEYGEIALRITRKLVRRLQEHYVISMPDLGQGLDILSSIRHPGNLLLDTIDCPENVDAGCDLLYEVWEDYYDRLSSMIDPGNHGCYTVVMRWLSGKPTHMSYCDFSAMISPAMFERFVWPVMERESAKVDGRLIYHLDGPGEIPHVDVLLEMEGLYAIQWVPGAGNPGCLDEAWDELYRKILDGGKRICIGAGAEQTEALKRLIGTFPGEAFLITGSAPDRASAEALVRVADRCAKPPQCR